MDKKIKSAFDEVKCSPELKQKTKAYLSDYSNARSKKPLEGLLALACACLVLIGTVFSGKYYFYTPVSAVSIEGESMVELRLNRIDRVISVDGYSEQGIKNKKCKDAVSILVSNEDLSEQELYITVTSKNQDKENNLLEAIKQCQFADSDKIYCVTGTQAKENGMSGGKYKLYIAIRQLMPQFSKEEAQAMSMHELKELYAKLSGTETAPLNQEHKHQHGKNN